jgi:nucleoside-diphosphate-sugar epimerase
VEAVAEEVDITQEGALKKNVTRIAPDVVFHLAACTEVRRDSGLVERCRRVNYEGTRNLVESLRGLPILRIVHFGTCEEYGNVKAPFSEGMTPRPVSPYSASKAKATLYMQDLWRIRKSPVVILRPFLTYGPGQAQSRFVAQAVRSALDDHPLPMTPGEQTREFTFIDDLLQGIIRAAAVPGIEGEIINLANGREHRLLDVARLIYRLAGSTAEPAAGALPYREGEAMRFFGDTKKCIRLLAYRPATPLREGLARVIEAERASREGERHA